MPCHANVGMHNNAVRPEKVIGHRAALDNRVMTLRRLLSEGQPVNLRPTTGSSSTSIRAASGSPGLEPRSNVRDWSRSRALPIMSLRSEIQNGG